MPPNRTKKPRQRVQHPLFPILTRPYRSSTYCNPADPQTDPQSVSVTPQSLSTMVVECKILSDNNPKKAKIRLGYALQLLN